MNAKKEKYVFLLKFINHSLYFCVWYLEVNRLKGELYMYNYGYNCYTPCAPVAPVVNNCGRGCGGGFAFILVLFILLAIICGCGGFGGRSCGCGCDCGCGC